jgi:hypothetical protein
MLPQPKGEYTGAGVAVAVVDSQAVADADALAEADADAEDDVEAVYEADTECDALTLAVGEMDDVTDDEGVRLDETVPVEDMLEETEGV